MNLSNIFSLYENFETRQNIPQKVGNEPL